MNPKVSIIIPAYNAEKTIEKCLNSIFSMSYSNWECIIVDDNSTDNTLQIINNLCKNKNIIITKLNEHCGVCKCRNYALDIAKGEYIFCLDSDDEVYKDFIERAVLCLDSDSTKVMAYANANIKSDKGETFVNFVYRSYKDILMLPIFHVSSLLRKSLIKYGWDINLKCNENQEFYINYLYHNDNIKFLSGYSIIYNINTAIKNNNLNDYSISLNYIKNKHKEKYIEYNV